jgi:transposase
MAHLHKKMNMAHLHKKMKKGRPYYYIREMKRINGKPKVTSQIYLGSVDTMLKRLKEAESRGKPLKVASRQFGALFLLNELEKELDTIGIIDGIVSRGARETGPGIGEYFFYAWVNRLIAPRSKRALSDWYKHTAIQEIRPVDLSELTSQRYWDKWERLSEEDSELCRRGHNKAGRHNLRQVGLALLVDRNTHLPLYYKAYEGNKHDSKLFRNVVDELFGVMCGFNQTKQRLTVVFDKGMNSDDGIHSIDDHTRIHFITTYSPYYIEELAGIDMKVFSPLDILKNKERSAEDRILAYRTRSDLWGQERTVVVTYNPRTARKKAYTFEKKLESIRETLLEYRRRYKEKRPHWRNSESIVDRYHRDCEKLHISSRYYNLEFSDMDDTPDMSFRKDVYQVTKAEKLFGRNVIVTDNHDWRTAEIVQLSLDRYGIENQFRSSKSKDHVRLNPFYHWTDSKIRCHLLTCAIALTVLRLLELRVNRSRNEKDRLSGKTILEEMSNLDSVWLWYSDKRKSERMIEAPMKTQSEVLKSFGWEVIKSGVLQECVR